MALTQVDQGLLGTYAQYTGFKNRLINSAMVIDQRNAGASVTPNSGNTYTVDRWFFSASQNTKFTLGRNLNSVSLPSGFINYLGASVASAFSSGSSDYFALQQSIEGLNISDLGWGTANAKPVTLSFQVYSSLTGTFSGALQNSGASRSYPFTYTVSSANTWTSVSVTIAGDTSGTWLTTNGVGISLNFNLGSGSTLLGTAGAWAGAWYIGATGANSIVANAGATFYITGVQLEKGSTATSFDYRPYTTELSLCQRYLPAWRANEAGNGYGFNGQAYSTTQALIILPFNVPARTRPTGIVVSSSSDFGLLNTNATALNAAGTVSFNQSTNFALMVGVSGSSGIVAGNATMMAGLNTSAYIYATGCEL